MKILIISGGFYGFSSHFASALNKYYEVSLISSCGKSFSYDYPFVENFHYLDNSSIKQEDIKNFDVILGLDHGQLPFLSSLKKNKNLISAHCKIGVQVLDFPAHVFYNDKNFNANAFHNWDNYYISMLKDMDFILHNQQIALSTLEKIHPNSVSEFVLHPVNRIEIEEYDRKDFIVYSGRISADKSVHYIIEALSILPEKIPLIAIGNGYDLTSYANYLGVDYKQMICSEEEKWKMYHECRFIVCAADNEYIPALCIMEGISIGRMGVSFNYEESKLHYKNFAAYCQPRDINSLSNTINHFYKNSNQTDVLSSGGPLYYESDFSYSAWAKKVNKIIEEVCVK